MPEIASSAHHVRPNFFREIRSGPRHAVSTPGDLVFHIRARRMDLCFELEAQIAARLEAAVITADEVHGAGVTTRPLPRLGRQSRRSHRSGLLGSSLSRPRPHARRQSGRRAGERESVETDTRLPPRNSKSGSLVVTVFRQLTSATGAGPYSPRGVPMTTQMPPRAIFRSARRRPARSSVHPRPRLYASTPAVAPTRQVPTIGVLPRSRAPEPSRRERSDDPTAHGGASGRQPRCVDARSVRF